MLTSDSPPHNSLRAGDMENLKGALLSEGMRFRTVFKAEIYKPCFLDPFTPCTVGSTWERTGRFYIRVILLRCKCFMPEETSKCCGTCKGLGGDMLHIIVRLGSGVTCCVHRGGSLAVQEACG